MTNKALVVIALFTMTVPGSNSPPNELIHRRKRLLHKSPKSYAALMLLVYFVGEDVDFQTCVFFQKALSTALAENNVKSCCLTSLKFWCSRSMFPRCSYPSRT